MGMENQIDVPEAEIAVHWQEEKYYYPPPEFTAQANLTDPKIYERFSLDNFPECFNEYADLLDWYKPWEKTLDTSNAPFWKWYVGGRINASHNCVDRHLAKSKNKTAIHFVPNWKTRRYSTSPIKSCMSGSMNSRPYCEISAG